MNKWILIILVLFGLFILAGLISLLLFDGKKVGIGNGIAIISISGVISTNGNGESFLMGDLGASSTIIIQQIKDVEDDPYVKGIIFEIDSPGGTVVASQEIADAVKSLDKPNYAVIREVGASGGYWVASSTDKIIASPMSITGSIGVLGSYLQFNQLFEKYGIEYERFIGGKYKDLGSPYKETTNEERELLQKKINVIHEYFIKEVAQNRKIDVSKIREIATGEFYLGSEAKEFGLIDEFGNRETAVELMKKELNITEADVFEVRREIGFFELFGGLVSYNFGRGFASQISKIDLENRFKISI